MHQITSDDTIYVGIDDTDSPEGMCTTYIACVIIDELKDFGYNIKGYPRLIRLNPFAKFKTRGNGAVSFKVGFKSKQEKINIKKIVLEKIEELSHLQDEKTDPGVVFYDGKITKELKTFSLETVRNIVSLGDAKKLADKIGAEVQTFRKGLIQNFDQPFRKRLKGRGIIGALAAIGCPLEDKTYELVAYRIEQNYGKKRRIDYESVFRMNDKMYPQTFDNVDNGYIAIEPHTPCPILYGIRGESPEAVAEAHNMIKSYEPIEKVVIFETNQHTDMHLIKAGISGMRRFKCYIADGVVKNPPYAIEGGHIIFVLGDDSAKIDCAAYEPTKGFRDVVGKLAVGDHLRVYGGIGSKGTLNVEKVQIIKLAGVYRKKNPLCECGKRMKSAGRGKGYRCRRCGRNLPEGSEEIFEVKRKIKEGFYEVPPSARRHLSKPLVRK